MVAAPVLRMTADEYLAWERAQEDKHEYFDGEVFAMAGGSLRHNVLCVAVGSELRAALRGSGCVVLSSDQRVAARPGRRYVYPDVVAACGGVRLEPGTTDVLLNPSVVVEVLSSATEAFDRGAKWEAYQRLDSVTDYLLVAQDTASIEHYARGEAGAWRYRSHGPGETLTLSNGATLSVDAIYEGAFDVAAS